MFSPKISDNSSTDTCNPSDIVQSAWEGARCLLFTEIKSFKQLTVQCLKASSFGTGKTKRNDFEKALTDIHRAFSQSKAKALNVSGWVKNTPDDKVVGEA